MTPTQTPDGTRPRGFYTARCVEASSESEAGLRAVSLVEADARIDSLRAEWRSSPPDLEVDAVVLLRSGEDFDRGQQGLILYDESEPNGHPVEN